MRVQYDPRSEGALCDSCPLKGYTVVPPKTVPNPRLYVVAEAPGRQEEQDGVPLIGTSGSILNKSLSHFSFPLEHLHKTNAILCRPPKVFSEASWKQALHCCSFRLRKELKDPKIPVLALGNKSLQVLTGHKQIFPWAGYPLKGSEEVSISTGRGKQKQTSTLFPSFSDLKVIGNLHPAFIARYPWYSPYFNVVNERAVDLAFGRFLPWHWPSAEFIEHEKVIEQLQKWLQEPPAFLAVDIETPKKDKYKLLNIGFSDGVSSVSLQTNEDDCPAQALDLTKQLLASSVPKVFHYGTFDRFVLDTIGYPVSGLIHDTMWQASVACPRIKRSLAFLASLFFPAPRWKAIFHQGDDKEISDWFAEAHPADRANYNARDAFMTAKLFIALGEQLRMTPSGPSLYEEILELGQVAYEAKREGFNVNHTALESHRLRLSAEISSTKLKLLDFAKPYFVEGEEEFSTSNGKHITRVFRKLGVPPVKLSLKTDKPSWDEEALEKLSDHPSEPVRLFAFGMRKLRKLERTLNTEINGLPIDQRTGKVHPTMTPCASTTGRWTCTDPNMFNRQKTEYGKDKEGNKVVRQQGTMDCFKAPDGHVIVYYDAKALEAWTLAYLSKDPVLTSDLKKKDIHTDNAKLIFGDVEISKTMRDDTKETFYGTNYGGSIKTIHKRLLLTNPMTRREDVERFVKILNAKYAKRKEWQLQQIDDCYANDRVLIPKSGRTHQFWGKPEHGVCLAFPNQGTGADWMNDVIKRITRQIKSKYNQLRFWIQIHDSIGIIAPAADYILAAALIQQEIERPWELQGELVTFQGSGLWGPVWGDSMKAFTEEELNAIKNLRL